MRKILLPGIVAALVATAGPTSAHPSYHYEGGCGFATLSDRSDNPDTNWRGEAHVVAVATDAVTGLYAPLTPISVECHVYKEGVFQGVILTASGVGFATGVTQYTYQASRDDVITLCDVVTVGGEAHTDCRDTTTSPILPEPVQETIDVVIDQIIRVLIWADPWICPVIGSLSGIWVPGVLDVTPEGDVYVAGEYLWDCPPY